jgi:hypothetical protein
MSSVGKPTGTEAEQWLPGAKRMGSGQAANGYKTTFCHDENILKLDVGEGYRRL